MQRSVGLVEHLVTDFIIAGGIFVFLGTGWIGMKRASNIGIVRFQIPGFLFHSC
jgi:hypothetical protein